MKTITELILSMALLLNAVSALSQSANPDLIA